MALSLESDDECGKQAAYSDIGSGTDTSHTHTHSNVLILPHCVDEDQWKMHREQVVCDTFQLCYVHLRAVVLDVSASYVNSE
jgi:hypothetical protein